MYPVIKVEVNNKKLGFSKKEINVITEGGYKSLAKNWHSQTLKEHFTDQGARKYKYKPRTKKYLNRQGKRGKPALVFTGQLMRRASMIRDITANSKGAKVKLKDLPKYTFMYWISAGGPKKYEELVAVTRREEVTMAKDMEKFMAKALNRSTRSKFIDVSRGSSAVAIS